MEKLPKHFVNMQKQYGSLMDALQAVGEASRQAGPLDEKTAHLIQLAASTAIRSEGAVHSHTRRALAAGAGADEIRQAVLLLTSTIGFPAVAAAMSWVEDVLEQD